MFQINDAVLYGVEGLYKISEITEMDFRGRDADYYVLKSLVDKNETIFVPLENESLKAKMRRILSEEEIYEEIHAMPDEDPNWIADEDDRVKAYKEILLTGNHREIIKLMKALYHHRENQRKIGKSLHKVDERMLKDAEKMIHGEFAYVLHLEPDQVGPFIQREIEEEGKRRAQA